MPGGTPDVMPGPVPEAAGEPVGRAEGRWLRGARRSGGARYAGAAAPEAEAVTMPPGQPSSATPLRGARFGRPARPAGAASAEAAWSPASGRPGGESGSTGRVGGPPGSPAWSRGHASAPGGPPAPDPGSRPHPQGEPTPWPDRTRADGRPADATEWPGSAPGSTPGGAPHGAPAQWAGAPGGFVEGLVALRGQGRSGEAHGLLCEAAAGPAEGLVRLGEGLRRAGLAADWATLLWEAASLPPARFAAAAAALGPADRDALLRQGAARPAAEIAEIALVLGTAGHAREADALLAAFVRVRTAEESARLARRDPQWFAPRLLRAAEALSGAHHRDLLHALRVANLPVA